MMDILSDYTLRNVILGSLLLGISSGTLGSFAVLREQSLLGDTVSHSALPGIALAFIITGTKAPLAILLGAALAGWIGAMLIEIITSRTRIKMDAAQGIILSVFFGSGIVLLTYIQGMPTAEKAGIDSVLFGQAASIIHTDVLIMAVLTAASLVIVMLLWKEIAGTVFDPGFTRTQGFPVRAIQRLLSTMLIIAIVIGLQIVGVVLMSAMVIAPAAAARQWTNRLGPMVGASALIGAASGISGSLIANSAERLPTGPVIVLSLTTLVVVSLIFGAKRGLVWDWMRRLRRSRVFALGRVLDDMYMLSDQHDDPEHPHNLHTIRALRRGYPGLRRSLKLLEVRGWVHSDDQGRWSITAEGRHRAGERLSHAADHPPVSSADAGIGGDG
jgi:manganese/zinc/iron transport system permease protein